MCVLDDWLLTAERVAVHLPSRTAVVADLHLGYAEARRGSGEAVPDDSLEDQLSGLGRVMEGHATGSLVVAGDLLEDGRCIEALEGFIQWLIRQGVERTTVVPGNHDEGLEGLSPRAGPLRLCQEGIELGKWRIVHGAGSVPDGPLVQGHEHPCFRWSPRARTIRPRFFGGRTTPEVIEGPCYLVGPRRLILPAFSQEAAGVNVLSSSRWRSYRCHVIAGDAVLDLGELSRIKKT
jgi:metallophosphoesterase superfamily enzyme